MVAAAGKAVKVWAWPAPAWPEAGGTVSEAGLHAGVKGQRQEKQKRSWYSGGSVEHYSLVGIQQYPVFDVQAYGARQDNLFQVRTTADQVVEVIPM